MKFHLPKKLMMAVLAAVACVTAEAATMYPNEVIEIGTGQTVTWTDYSNMQKGNASTPLVKDGEGTLKLDGLKGDTTAGNYYKAPLVAREGSIEIVDSSIFAHGASTPNTGSTSTWLMVGGKEAEMSIKNSSFNIVTGESHMNVGTCDGTGTLTIDNSNVKLHGSLFMGIHEYATNADGWGLGYYYNYNGTAASDNIPAEEQNFKSLTHRYTEGTYVDGFNGQMRRFGKGVLNVTNGSQLNIATAFTLGYADVNISGAGTKVTTQTGFGGIVSDGSDWQDTYSVTLGRWSGAVSNLTISDGANMETYGQIRTDRSTTLTNTKSTVTVSGTGTELNVKASINLGIVANGADNGNETHFNVLDGGKVTAANTYLGNASGKNNITMNVGKGSTYTSAKFNINNAGVTVNNSGAITATTVTITGGKFSMNGADAVLDADQVTVYNNGTLEAVGSDAVSVDSDSVTVEEGGIVSLKDGSTLNVTGALTMESGSILRLSANGYKAGDTVLSSDSGDLDVDGATLEVVGGQANYIIKNGTIIITAVFDNSIAEALTVTNWGIASASRTFVNAVRGQRTNTGCIANGRGTAWAAVLGGTSDIGNGDIDLKGAAVGADMKVSEKSSVGVAVGYTDGDAKIPGLSKAEQEGTYVALYGEHGLKKLSDTSCLSLDWVAAYGQTETEWESADWEQQSLQLNTRLNWNKKLTDRLCMSVFGGLEYFTSESDRVENAKTGSIQNLRGEIGVGARYVAWGAPGAAASYDEKGALVTASRPGCEKLVLHGEIRYMNDMVRSNPVIEQDGLRGDGDNPGRQGMGIEAGATYRIGERWSASANYGFNTMDDSREHRVNVGASYTF